MKTFLLCVLTLLLVSCKDTPTQIISTKSVIRAHVYFQDQNVGGVPVILTQTSDTVRTDANGIALFHVAAGVYIVKFDSLVGPGPSPHSFTDTVDARHSDTTKVEVFDCLACVSADSQNADVQFSLTPSTSEGSPQNPVTISFQILNTGTIPKVCGVECDYLVAPGVDYQIYGPDSKVLPKPSEPRCPDGEMPFPGGANLSGNLIFNGTYYDWIWRPYTAHSGWYTVLASFTYWIGNDYQHHVIITREAAFKWKEK